MTATDCNRWRPNSTGRSEPRRTAFLCRRATERTCSGCGNDPALSADKATAAVPVRFRVAPEFYLPTPSTFRRINLYITQRVLSSRQVPLGYSNSRIPQKLCRDFPKTAQRPVFGFAPMGRGFWLIGRRRRSPLREARFPGYNFPSRPERHPRAERPVRVCSFRSTASRCAPSSA